MEVELNHGHQPLDVRQSAALEHTDPVYITVFQSDCLKRHNELRMFHGCAPLKLSESLSARAQAWAEHLSDSDKFTHSVDRRRTGVGENLAFKWYTDGQRRPNGDEIADIWYNEVRDYSWEVPELNLTRFAGHFTQLIWANTTQVGFGVAADGKGKVTVVAQYQCAGNVKGQYEINVPPRIDGLPMAWPEQGAATTVPKGRRSLVVDRNAVVDVDTLPSKRSSVGGSSSSSTSSSSPIETEGVTVSMDEQLTTMDRSHAIPRGPSITLSMSRHRTTLENLHLYSIKAEAARQDEISLFFKKELKYGQEQREFILNMVDSHNKLRKEFRLPLLLLSPELSRVAQEHAEKLSTMSDDQPGLTHSTNVDFGENLAFVENDQQEIDSALAESVTRQWFSRKDATNSEEGYAATQIVWKDTKLLGVGLNSVDGGQSYFVVCNYYPPGNVYEENNNNDNNNLNRSASGNSQTKPKGAAAAKQKKKKRGCLGIC